MPSMDIVSKLEVQELANAVDQTNREIATRFDFKGTQAQVSVKEYELQLEAEGEFQIQQITQILDKKLVKRGIDLNCLESAAPVKSGKLVKQTITARAGIDAELAKKIVKLIKQSKLKVQAAIQQDQVRVSGKKRDDLQQVISLVKTADFNLPLQFINFRD